MADGTAKDRRRHERISVEIWVEETRGRELYYLRAANLSRGGIFLENTIPHPYGTLVELEFTLPGHRERIHVRGRVVNRPETDGGLGMAVEFIEMEPAVARQIEEFVDAEAPA
jgi:uncharacterized protein (TIGR02266 family)